MTRRIRPALLLILLLSTLFLACGGSEAVAPSPTKETAQQAGSASPTPEPTATPADVVVTEAVLFRDASDTYHVGGRVTNFTDEVVGSVEIAATLLDEGGNLLSETTNYLPVDLLAPGGSAYFDLPFYDEIEGAADGVASVVAYEVEEMDSSPPSIDLQGVSLRFVPDEGLLYLTGEIVNDNPIAAHIAGITAGALQGERLVGVGQADIFPQLLLPNESGPFLLSVAGEGIEGARVDLLISATPTEADEAFSFTFADDAYFYASVIGSYHLVGSVTNDGDVPVSLSLLAALYDAQGKVLDVSRANVPYDPIAPGDSATFDFQFWDLLNFVEGVGEKVSSYSIQVDRGWTWTTDYQMLPLDSVIETVSRDKDSIEVTGSVTNHGSTDVDNVLVIVDVYDEGGNLVGTATAYEEGLAVGKSCDFDLLVWLDPQLEDASLTPKVIARGEPAD